MEDARSLDQELDLELERAKRGSRRLSVLIGELSAGDRNGDRSSIQNDSLLQRVAAVFVEQKRQIDALAALDGRFVLILPETDESGALAVAERLRAAVAAVFRDQGDVPKLSFGVASFGRHGRSSNALLDAAERALRIAQKIDRQSSLIDPNEIAAAMASVTSESSGAEGRLETALALAETVDVRDRGVAGHSHIVGRYASLIARELGLSDETIERVRLAGILHDVGKVGVTRTVLQKPGPLSDREWNAIRTHSEIGSSLLDGPDLSDISEWVLRHHERPDGGGYPDGLRGSEIPLEARIIAVADAYEAMTSDRVHRAALSHDEARVELANGAGTQFDSRVVDAFIRVLQRQGLGSSRAAA